MGASLLSVLSRRGRPTSPASLPPGVLLAWHKGRHVSELGFDDTGPGGVTGASDASTAGHWTNAATAGAHLKQVTPGDRPYVGYHARGRGIALYGGSSRRMVGASALSGGKYFFAAITPIGSNGVRAGGDEPAVFASVWQMIASTAGTTDFGRSFPLGQAGTGAFYQGAPLSGPCYIDGVETLQIGRWGKRRVLEFHRSTDITSGALTLFRDGDGVYPWLGAIHEVIILSSSATEEHRQLVRNWLAWHQATPTILTSCDSLLVGYDENRYDSANFKLWEHYRRCVSVVGMGIQGQTLVSAISGDPAKFDAYIGLGRNIIVLLGGANDVLADVDASTVLARLQAHVDESKTRGQVVVCTIPTGPGYSTPRANVIASVRTSVLGGALTDVAAVVDLYGANAPTLRADGIHFDTAGLVTVANAIAEATDALHAALPSAQLPGPAAPTARPLTPGALHHGRPRPAGLWPALHPRRWPGRRRNDLPGPAASGGRAREGAARGREGLPRARTGPGR